MHVSFLKRPPLEAPCKENPIDGPPPLPSCSCISLTSDCPAKTLLSSTELEGAPRTVDLGLAPVCSHPFPTKTLLSSTELEGAPGTVDLGLAPVCSHPFAQLELVPFTPMNHAKIKVEYSNIN